MGHVTEHVPGIAYNLVGSMTFDVADEPDTTHFVVRCGIWVVSAGGVSVKSGRQRGEISNGRRHSTH
jgi:hypothetical protein